MPDQSFYEQRLGPLGVTKENNNFTVINEEAEHPMPKRYDANIFSEDKDGNIRILFWTLDRRLITYIKMGDGKMSHINGKPQHFYQIRLKQPKGDTKYIMPQGKYLLAAGQEKTFPWIAPELVELWEDKQKITTLFITEGAFKGWLGNKCGIPVIGLTSITHYASRDGQLHKDIQRIIIDCEVENIVIIWDGDCLDISENALSKREDLIKRPLGFYSAAKKIRQLVAAVDLPEGRGKPAVYFSHVVSEMYPSKPKGLDDLLICAREKNDVQAVVKQAMDPQAASTFFRRIDITDTTVKMKEYFALDDPERFYKRHAGIIKLNEFRYRGDLMKYSDADGKEELELIAPAWAEELRWIGDEYFIECEVPSARKGKTRKELKPRNQGTLEKIYQRRFWKYLKHFEGFCNVPSHDNYKQVIELNGKEFYNRYFPFKHVPEEGGWPTILNFVKHIFGEDEVLHELSGERIPRWQLGLDYIQILYKQPTAMLPVLILFSQENGTGKSTFGRLMSAMFSDNVVPIGNADLQSDFNETYSDKLLAICEETLLDRKKDVERIKSLSTNPRILVNPKGQKQYQIDFFCKFIFMSNNPRMIYVTRHDTRFWILRVPQFEKEIPDFAELMEAEIPAFLHSLSTRKMKTEREGRMHFHPSLLKTDTFEETVRVNEPTAAADMREEIIQMFLQDKNLDRIEMPLKDIRENFFGMKTSTGWIKEILRDYLQVDQLLGGNGKAKVKRGEYPWWEKNTDGSIGQKMVSFIGRPYVFHRKDFITDVDPQDYKEIEEAERNAMQGAMGGNNVPNKPLTEEPKDDLPF